MTDTRWAVFKRWRDEPQGGGRGWHRADSISFDSLYRALAHRDDLEKEDWLLNGPKMSYCVETIEVKAA